MRKAFYLLSFLTFFILFIHPVVFAVLSVLLLIFSNVKKQYLILGLLILLLRLQYRMDLIPSDVGRVIELNEKSLVVESRGSKVRVVGLNPLLFGLNDRIRFTQPEAIEPSVSFFGFDAKAYGNAHHIYTQAYFIEWVESAPAFFEWISLKNAVYPDYAKWYRALLLQASFEGMALFFSLGLVYESALWLIRKIFFFLKGRAKHLMELSVLLSLVYVLFFPLTLVRVFISSVLKMFNLDAQARFHGLILLMYLYEPYALTQLSVLIPLSFMFVFVYLPKSYRLLNQYLMVTTVFLSIGMSVSVLSILIYPSLRKLYKYVVLVLMLALCLPILQVPLVIILEQINDFVSLATRNFTIKGQLNVGLLSILLGVLIISLRIRPIFFSLSFLGLILCLHPLSLLPLYPRIWMINVGQGDAFIFQSALNKEVYVLDTGNRYAYPHLKQSLDGLGIYKIDALIITHLDADHSANIEALSTDFDIKVIETDGKNYPFFDTELKYLKVHDFESENDNSLIYLIESKFTFLFLADVSKQVETLLVKQYPKLELDVLKIAHHGSDSSSSYELLLRSQAEIALISVGENPYGHPSSMVLDRLKTLNMVVFNTQEDGDVLIEIKKDQLNFYTAQHENFVYFD